MGGETRTVGAGESVFVPRGSEHAYVNGGSEPCRMLAVYTPSGMEGWFREVCTPVTDPAAPPPAVTPELIARMLEAGPAPQRRVVRLTVVRRGPAAPPAALPGRLRYPGHHEREAIVGYARRADDDVHPA